MRHALRVVGFTTAFLFGATLVEAAWLNERGVPQRVKEEMKARQEERAARREEREAQMAPEERAKREAATLRRKARINKYLINPIKKIIPHRRSGKKGEQVEKVILRRERTPWGSRKGIPKRVREEMGQRPEREIVREEKIVTPEEIARRKEARRRVKAKIDKYIVNPIKSLRPRRRPGSPDAAAAARRRERMKKRIGGLVPHRYPKGRSTDSAVTPETTMHVQPASFSTEEPMDEPMEEPMDEPMEEPMEAFIGEIK